MFYFIEYGCVIIKTRYSINRLTLYAEQYSIYALVA